ncbi:MAG: DNA (cytosine-5-)-methyltransferase [Lachnospiraceae bacterium]|nr:DNA (cytosine-5-)-methyltransferase [Lachnospiraceae bacterium]
MTFLDLFAGIGGFRRGLERSGHVCVGHVEIDKYANKSYMAMYGLEYCPYGTDSPGANSCRMCRQEVREHCDGTGCGGKCKGEWYAKDIKQLTAGEVPKAEIWTFGFPCTDISVSGRMAGLHGERSGLFFAVTGLLKGTASENKPGYLIIENVKNLVSNERGGDFTSVLFELWEAGYDCEWHVINSKDHGVPQHRERVYIVGYLGGRSRRKIFPLGGANPAPVKRLLGGRQGERVYDSAGTAVTLTAAGGGFAGQTGLYAVPVDGAEDIAGKQGWDGILAKAPSCASFIDLSREPKLTGLSRSVMAKQYAGITNHKGETSGIFFCKGHPECVRAVITPGRMEKRQNGRRFKEPGEPSFTLTCQDRHGVLLCCRIRRLTPRECWRLQAFDDFLFDRAEAAGLSDAQLYKQAGNAVTVNVVYEIECKLAESEVADEV